MPVTWAQQEQYAGRMDRVVGAALRLQGQASDAAAALIDETVRHLADKILSGGVGKWTSQGLASYVSYVGGLSERMGAQLTASTVGTLGDMLELGTQAALMPFPAAAQAQVLVAIPSISPQLVNVLGDYTADLIQAMTAEFQANVVADLRLAISSGQSLLDTVTALRGAIEGDLAGSGGNLTFPTAWHRAETIARTETMRAYSLADQVRSQELAAGFPGTLKAWLATDDHRTRKTHREAWRNYWRDPIPMNEWFLVGECMMRFPLDPSARPMSGGPGMVARETCNCRCVKVNRPPRAGELVFNRDAAIRAGRAEEHGLVAAMVAEDQAVA